MISRRAVCFGLAASAASAVVASSIPAFAAAPVRARNVVLVHGAYADGSSWSEVIPLLQKAGLNVSAVQNPLMSLEEDCAYTRRVLALQDGPTVLVAHSYGGEVLTETGVDPKVTALVYCAARAPDAGEDYTALAKTFPAPPASAGVVHSGGFAQLSEQAFLRDFAGDVDPVKARALYAVQGRIADTLFSAKVTQAAWHTKPSFYAVSTQDRTINPDLQRFMAKRMKAKTIEIPASHLAIVSRPAEIAALILEAAGAQA
ncbi:MAG TPA: alpha/beta hydrolase [Dongiaceae bacterium]|nr:alpha/beta hydrolase [Dongiaceae bacterium]